MTKHKTRYLTQRQFNAQIAKVRDLYLERLKKLRAYERKGYRYKRVWIEPHSVPKYKTKGHYMNVLVKASA